MQTSSFSDCAGIDPDKALLEVGGGLYRQLVDEKMQSGSKT